jgi:hypothetical protein
VTDTNEASRSTKALTAEKLYAELCSSIRTTDEISFKLLGLVPLVSGAGIVLALDDNRPWSPMTIFIGLFGAAVTFAIYRWEVRNINICKWLRDRACDLEREELGLAAKGQFYKRDDPPNGPPKVLGWRMGKTEAERLLYAVTIGAWLLLPIVAAVSD